MVEIFLNRIKEKTNNVEKTYQSTAIIPTVRPIAEGLCPTGTYIPAWDNFYGAYTCHWLNTDLSRWVVSGNVEITTEQSFRGGYSIKIADSASSAEHSITNPIDGTSVVKNVTCRFRFYDTGATTLRTFCGLISPTGDKIMIGVDTSISPDYYIVLNGFISRVTTISRTTGWHDIVFGSDTTGSIVKIDEVIPVTGYVGGVVDVAKIRLEGGPTYYDEIKMFDIDKHTCGTNAMIGSHDFGAINPGESRSDEFFARGYVSGNFCEFGDPSPGTISISEGVGMVPASWVSGYPIQMEYYWEEHTGPYVLHIIPFTITVPVDATPGDYTLQFVACTKGQWATICGGTNIGVAVGVAPGGGIARITDFTSKPNAISGEAITICSGRVWNDGTSDTLFLKLIDRDDGLVIAGQDFPLTGGDNVPLTITGVMPAKDYNIRLEFGHYIGGDPAQPNVDDFREFTILLAGTGTVSGYVRDSGGIGIANALVEVNGYSSNTDTTGLYMSPAIPAGNYTITISATGYVTVSEPITILENQKITKDFALGPITTGEVAGWVRDPGNNPIPYANITINGYSGSADAYGNYRIPNIEAGSYTSTASNGGYEPASQLVDVVAGATAVANFTLTPVPIASSSVLLLGALAGGVGLAYLFTRK